MNMRNGVPQKKGRGLWWKIILGILLTLSLVLAFVILNLDSIARSQINKALDRYLVAGGKLETIDIHLMEGRIALGGLTINSPPESGPEPLFDLGELEVDVDPFALFSGKVLVEHVTVNGLSLNIVRNEQGRLSPLELVSTASIKDEPETVEDEKESGLPWISTVHVKFIQVAGLSFRLNDRLMDKQWYAGLDLDLAITGLRLEDHAQFDISVDSIDLALSQITVDQVPGFGTQKLFSLDHFTVVSGKSDMASTELVVEKVLLQGLSSSVTMRSDGLTNLQKLKGALFDSADENRPNKEAATAVAETPSLKSVLPTVRFEQILLENGSATYRDEAFADEPLVAVLNQIHMEATQLHMFTDDKSVDPASATLSFELEQPGDLPKAYFGTLAGVGPVGNGIPLVNTQVRLVGLKLETLGSLVPLETRTVLGVTGLDVGMAMALNENSINLNASILTDRNIKYEGITVRGFLDAPVVKNGLVLTGVFGQVSDGLVNIGKDGLKSGVHIAAGGAEAVKELGTGAVEVGKNLGKGLFETAAVLVTFDKQKIEDGVSGTDQAAGDGLKSSTSDLKGEGRVSTWEKNIPSRYQKTMQQAQDALAQMPYPPVTK